MLTAKTVSPRTFTVREGIFFTPKNVAMEPFFINTRKMGKGLVIKMVMKKKRVAWIDIFKLLGIIAIFCGHFGTGSGKLYEFVFYYHVPLFFFSSGMFADHLENLSFKDAIKKRFAQIMIPYLFLVIINMGMIIITSDSDYITYLKYVKQFIWGIRNQMPASSLWFYSCIFCMSALFEILRRLLKKNVWILIASGVIYFVSITLFQNRPDVQPSWIWNFDSACYYLIYYAFGYTLHTRLLKERKEMGTKKAVFLLMGAGILAGYTLSVYLKEDVIGAFLYRFPMVDMIYPVLRATLLIFFNIFLAKALENFHFLAYAGSQTLWLCGNEQIVKKVCSAAVEVLGLHIEIASALSAIVYAVVMVMVVMKVLLPVEKKIYQKYYQYIAALGAGKKESGEA